MKGLIFGIAALAAMCVFTGCADDTTKSCVRPAYCVSYSPTEGVKDTNCDDKTNTCTQCYSEVEARDTHVTKYKKENLFLSQEDKCWDQ